MFYGSVDITNDIRDANKIFVGVGQYLSVPYFPGIHLFLWIGGLLILHSPIPVGLAFKLFPSLFDAAIAVLLIEFGANTRDGLRRAWLYALAPVPLFITCIHGQWDSLFLFCLLLAVWARRFESERGDMLAGAAYTLSVAAKPVAAPLFLFFLPTLRDIRVYGRTRARRMLISLAGSVAAYGLLLMIIGYPLDYTSMEWVAKYANVGVQLIGLPELLPVPRWRLLGLVSLVPLLWLFWRGRISRERAFLLFFLAVIGWCGLGPQYLFWIVPFAFAVGEIRFAAVYNFLSSVALLCYYQSAGVEGMNFENFGALAPLKWLAWLSPVPGDVDLKTLAVAGLANLAIPLLCLGAFAIGILRAVRTPVTDHYIAPAPRAVTVLAVFLAAAILIATAWAWTMPPPPKGTSVMAGPPPLKKDRFVILALRKALAQYALVRYTGRGLVDPQNPALLARSLVEPVPSSPVNVTAIGLAAAALWTAAAYGIRKAPD